MPELPEVECLARSLYPMLVGSRITHAQLRRRDVFVPSSFHAMPGGIRVRAADALRRSVLQRDLLEDCVVADLQRRGKQLIICATMSDGSSRALVVHFGMTGSLRWSSGESEKAPDHTHVEWRVMTTNRESGILRFIDPRRFGGLRAFETMDSLERHLAKLGADALTIDAAALGERFSTSRKSVKSVLLDQSVIAGIGNIYADEALFHAGIHPLRCADSLSDAQIATLADELHSVLRRAIALGGSTVRDYRDANGTDGQAQREHAVYGRAGLACVRCDTPLRHTIVAQRTTVYCPRCQRARRCEHARV
jgi:formamidopyrimidine-DNA glycosylase